MECERVSSPDVKNKFMIESLPKEEDTMEREKIDKRRMPAELCSCVDENKSNLHLEFTIPGVKKENIDLKMNSDSFSLKAETNDVEYVSTGNFCCPVEIRESDATYENGLLLINIPLTDPWENAYTVPIH